MPLAFAFCAPGKPLRNPVMPRHHKVLLAGTTLLVPLTLFCVPWRVGEGGRAYGYRPIFLPPNAYAAHVDVTRLAVQSLLVIGVTAVGMFITKPRGSEPTSKPGQNTEPDQPS